MSHCIKLRNALQLAGLFIVIVLSPCLSTYLNSHVQRLSSLSV